jgi:hypothetical protein
MNLLKKSECRFAFDFIMELASSVRCQIIVANQESLSPQQELVEDLIEIQSKNQNLISNCVLALMSWLLLYKSILQIKIPHIKL